MIFSNCLPRKYYRAYGSDVKKWGTLKWVEWSVVDEETYKLLGQEMPPPPRTLKEKYFEVIFNSSQNCDYEIIKKNLHRLGTS